MSTEDSTENDNVENPKTDLLQHVTKIVAGYVSYNPTPADQLATLIGSVHDRLSDIQKNKLTELEPLKPVPAVPVKKSVSADYLICLEDGKKLKMLKRHLRTSYDMTPDEYRSKWGLPPDYPMTAPNYAKQRSRLAKKIGLGRNRNQ